MMQVTGGHADMARLCCLLHYSAKALAQCSTHGVQSTRYSINGPCSHIQQYVRNHWNRPEHCAAAAAVQVALD